MLNEKLIIKTFENQMREAAHSINQFENVPNNSVYKIETESRPYIFKVYSKRDWPEDGKIPFVYRKLSEYNIPHARLFTFNREDNNFQAGYSIEEFLPGTTADRLALSENETISVFEKLAVLISRVHKIEMKNFGYIGNGEKPAIWTTFSEYMYDVLNDNAEALTANGFIELKDLKEINGAIYKKLKSYDIFPPVLCHGDLSNKNIMVDSNEITLIDWDDSQSMCWASDIASLTFLMKINYGERLAAECRKAFLDRYETIYDLNVFYELEEVHHIWNAFDALTFFTQGETSEKVKTLLRKSRIKCEI